MEKKSFWEDWKIPTLKTSISEGNRKLAKKANTCEIAAIFEEYDFIKAKGDAFADVVETCIVNIDDIDALKEILRFNLKTYREVKLVIDDMIGGAE